MSPDWGAAFVFAADGTTAGAGTFNAAWLWAHWLRQTARGRRLAACCLAVLNAGIAVQAVFSQALFTAHRFDVEIDALFAPASWLASRALLLAGTLLLSALIVRRVR
jgi:hypothetical protein